MICSACEVARLGPNNKSGLCAACGKRDYATKNREKIRVKAREKYATKERPSPKTPPRCAAEGCEDFLSRVTKHGLCRTHRSASYVLAGRATRAQTPERTRRNNLWAKFQMTVEQYDARLEAQGGLCAICARVPPVRRRPAVDHDRACCSGNKSCGSCVRALLCDGCNIGLGSFEDDPVRLRAAADYVESFRH